MPLEFLKEKQSYFTKALLILLAITFVVGFGFVGGLSIGGGGPPGGTAVEVNGEKVPLAQFYNLRDALYSQYKQQIPNLPDDAIDFVTARALDSIVELKLMSQKARELGLRISDQELSDAIKSNPAFQLDGKFVGAQRYQDFITNRLNQSIGEFEKGYKDELLAQKLVALINESAKVTEEELLSLYKTQNEEVNVHYVVFSPDDYASSIEVTDEEISNYYENNKTNFLTQEERKVKYLKIQPEAFQKNAEVSEDELKAYYNAYKDEFKIGDEQRGFDVVKSEIETKLKEAKSSAYFTQFLNTLESQSDKIKSLDKLSAENGFGEVKESFSFKSTDPSTDIPSDVKAQAFTVEKGKVTFKETSDAVWVVEVSEVKEQQQKDLDLVKADISDTLRNIAAKDKARVVADETLNKFNNSTESFSDTAKSLNLELKDSDYFTRVSGFELASNEDLTFDAFQLKPEDKTSSKVYSAGNNFYIISLKDKKPIDMDDFEQNKIVVKQTELARQQNEIVSNWVDRIRSEAKIVPNQKLFQPQG